jgi:uncharacterized protein
MGRRSLSGVVEAYRGERVRVFRLDRAATLEELRRRAGHLLTQRPEVLEIRLFGSLARNDATPGSDADLLIVVREDPGPFLDRAELMARYFTGVGVGCDIFVYTEGELERLGRQPASLVRTALREGMPLAGRHR